MALVAAGTAAPASPVPRRDTRTVAVPRTLAGALDVTGKRGLVHLSFPATHIVFSWKGDEGGGVRYRIGGELGSSWRRAPESGDHGAGGRHHSAVIAIPRTTTIRYAPIPSPHRVRDIRIEYMNTIDGPVLQRQVPVAARSSAEEPSIVTRAEWGADESMKRTTGTCRRAFYPVQQLFVHHTAGSNRDPNPEATMRAIYQYHVGSRGWCDIGYNFVIGRDGRIFEGRWARKYAPWETHTGEDLDGNATYGAHVSGYNSGSVGISLMGNFQSSRVPAAMRDALVEILAWEVDRHDLQPKGRHTYRNPDTGTTKRLPYIAGHRDAGQTSCPGAKLYRILPDIRDEVAVRIGAGRPSSELDMTTPLKKVDYGTEVDLSGLLKLRDGAPMPGRSVILHRKNGRGTSWFDESSLLTDVDGTFEHSIAAERHTKLRAEFPGAPDAWGSQSQDVKVKVRHLASLEVEGGAPDTSGTVIFPGGTESVGFSGSGAPVHLHRTVKVHVFRIFSDGSSKKVAKEALRLADDGSYSYVFDVPAGSGARTFTAVAWYPKDGQHLAGRSETARFVIAG